MDALIAGERDPRTPTGQHWHCQWGMGFSTCGWKWADNTDATALY